MICELPETDHAEIPALAAIPLVIPAGSAPAADLAHRSRLGAVFAEPPVVVRGAVVDRRTEVVVLVDPGYVRNSPPVAGYYGQAGDFHYRNYYGTPRPLLRDICRTACCGGVLSRRHITPGGPDRQIQTFYDLLFLTARHSTHRALRTVSWQKAR